jgi:hypothetical protein
VPTNSRADPDWVYAGQTTVDDAAAILADQLRRVPGVENHLALRLHELEARGPRGLRAAWRLGRSRVGERYGSMTVGELIARFAPGSSREN